MVPQCVPGAVVLTGRALAGAVHEMGAITWPASGGPDVPCPGHVLASALLPSGVVSDAA